MPRRPSLTLPTRMLRTAALTAAAGLIVGPLIAASPATAQATTMTPEYPSAQAAPALDESAHWAGLKVLKVNGTPYTGDDDELADATGTGAVDLTVEPRTPDPASGYRLQSAFRGTFTIHMERTAQPTDTSAVSEMNVITTADGPTWGGIFPDHETALSDTWFQSHTTGGWAMSFDFSGMPGRALEAGTLMDTSDVDICSDTPGGQSESVTMRAPQPGSWARFVYEREIDGTTSGTHPTVTQDESAGSIHVAAACSDVNLNQWFLTTASLPRFTVIQQNTIPNGGWLYYGLHFPLEPIPTPSSTAPAVNTPSNTPPVPTSPIATPSSPSTPVPTTQPATSAPPTAETTTADPSPGKSERPTSTSSSGAPAPTHTTPAGPQPGQNPPTGDGPQGHLPRTGAGLAALAAGAALIVVGLAALVLARKRRR